MDFEYDNYTDWMTLEPGVVIQWDDSLAEQILACDFARERGKFRNLVDYSPGDEWLDVIAGGDALFAMSDHTTSLDFGDHSGGGVWLTLNDDEPYYFANEPNETAFFTMFLEWRDSYMIDNGLDACDTADKALKALAQFQDRLRNR